MAEGYTILNGPSKFDLMTSIFVGNGAQRHTVRFLVKYERHVHKELPMEVIIQGVERRAGSDEHWGISGLWVRPGMPRKPINGRYRTDSRRGTMFFEEE